jgi:hypothetical protein
MKKICLLESRIMFLAFILLTPSFLVSAQVTDAEKKLRDNKLASESGWKTVNNLSIAFSQVSLTNWSAGGLNSMSVNGRFNGIYAYKKEKLSWDNQVDLGYGLMKQGKAVWQKTDDRLELMSKVGYVIKDKLNAAGLVDLKSQFAPGYDKPEGGKLISAGFAPAYLLGAAGVDYNPSDNFSLFVSPVTAKMTFVLNDSLSSQGAFGLDPGKKFRAELGGYVRAMWKHEVMKNVSLQSKVDLFSNYLHEPQYIDVNWEIFILMKINKYLAVTLNTILIYDHDILIGKDTTGDGVADNFAPRVQFKELFGFGLSFTL